MPGALRVGNPARPGRSAAAEARASPAASRFRFIRAQFHPFPGLVERLRRFRRAEPGPGFPHPEVEDPKCDRIAKSSVVWHTLY